MKSQNVLLHQMMILILTTNKTQMLLFRNQYQLVYNNQDNPHDWEHLFKNQGFKTIFKI